MGWNGAAGRHKCVHIVGARKRLQKPLSRGSIGVKDFLLVTQAWLFNAYVSVLLCRARIGPQAALCPRWAQQEVMNLKTVPTSDALLRVTY